MLVYLENQYFFLLHIYLELTFHGAFFGCLIIPPRYPVTGISGAVLLNVHIIGTFEVSTKPAYETIIVPFCIPESIYRGSFTNKGSG